MSPIEKNATAAIDALVDESPEKAMSFLASNFVGLILAMIEIKGGDVSNEIKINGGDSRDITIHAKKKGGAA
ncbi:hypothetical protein [Limnohabitans sp.]|uniref:hypothetical protein n=1 Tax=Limnohabitans sp. TaxID=1907725 RepID=UPI00286F5EEB|nr:hypothetical protein [Limnohabitans sp.]